MRYLTLFERCPLCREGKVRIIQWKILFFTKMKVEACPVCSAEFIMKDRDRYQLVYCDPDRIASRGGHGQCRCRDRVFHGCYLGMTLHKSEWERISRGEGEDPLELFNRRSLELLQGSFKIQRGEEAQFGMEPGEVIYYVSYPVYLDEAYIPHRDQSEKGRFILTNKRIIYVCEKEHIVIPLRDVEDVEDAQPGFTVRVKGLSEPIHFFPPLNDPLSAAVKGALRKLQG